jgi:nitrogen fixation NifU-like protein
LLAVVIMNMYHELLLDHYKYPRHKGTLENPDFSSGQYNPSCGDRVAFQGKITDGTIAQIAFEGSGCVISLATASLLGVHILNKPVSFAQHLTPADMVNMIGIELGPTRLKCALLPLEAVQEGIKAYQAAADHS